jgi:hypothetical protein
MSDLRQVLLEVMKRIFLIALGLSIFAGACTDPVAPPAPTPVVPTITETFADTLIQFGSNTHQFTVQQVGGLKVSLSDVNPPSAVAFGVGTQSLVGCTLISEKKYEPGATAQLSGTATTAGQFCVMVKDSGTLTEPVTYTVTVLHS